MRSYEERAARAQERAERRTPLLAWAGLVQGPTADELRAADDLAATLEADLTARHEADALRMRGEVAARLGDAEAERLTDYARRTYPNAAHYRADYWRRTLARVEVGLPPLPTDREILRYGRALVRAHVLQRSACEDTPQARLFVGAP